MYIVGLIILISILQISDNLQGFASKIKTANVAHLGTHQGRRQVGHE